MKIEDNKWIFIDAFGSKITDKSFKSARAFNEGLAAVAIFNDKLIDIKKSNKIDEISKRYCISHEPKIVWGFINVNGDFVINPEYSKVSDFIEGIAHVEYESKTFGSFSGYIDKMGNKYW